MTPGGITLEQDAEPWARLQSQNQQPHGHPCFVVRFWAVQPCPHQRCPGLKTKSQVMGQTSNRLQDVGAGAGAPGSLWLPTLSSFHVQTHVGAMFR